MPSSFSPLRYPGGKSQLYDYVKRIIDYNDLLGETYVEPFAGGAGLAMKLLLNNDVKRIIINDYDFAIYSIWYCILNYTDDFCDRIQQIDISIEEHDRQRTIYNSGTTNIFDMGIAAFYLNRTNRSGVIKGGVIGGREQSGLYKIDARFNKDALIKKIRAIAKEKGRIVLYNLDAMDFLSNGVLDHYYKTFVNFDPPYVMKGSQLYKNAFSEQDNKDLYKLISKCKRKWIVTYDICPLIRELYKNHRGAEIDINYSASNSGKAREYIFFSNNLFLPEGIELTNQS